MNAALTKKAAVIAIGTEITSGEILNGNSSTIAGHLTELGFLCDLHLSVPDETHAITWALTHATQQRDLVITTGGLGPTTDDFTRNIISNFTKCALEWSEESWNQITARLQAVGAPIAQSNRQQAFFPKGATIYPNHHGTAAAFSLSHQSTMILALPGPPSEIQGLWFDYIEEELKKLAPASKTVKPLKWQCLGLSESRLGELVETALQGSGLLTGYRSRLPYIDVKIWVQESQKERFYSHWKNVLEEVLKPWLVATGDEDVRKIFLDAIPPGKTFSLFDLGTHGHLAKRIFEEDHPNLARVTVTTKNSDLSSNTNSDFRCTVSINSTEGSWSGLLLADGDPLEFSGTSRYRGAINQKRLQAFAGEQIFVQLGKFLRRLHVKN